MKVCLEYMNASPEDALRRHKMITLPEPDLHNGVILRRNGRFMGTEDGYTKATMLEMINRIAELEQQLDERDYSNKEDSDQSALHARIAELENMLFAKGAMTEAPCFCCGYNGPGYFQPDKHPCARRHHKLYEYESE